MTGESVLDPCCGSRMWWFDKTDQRAVFGDLRSETIVVKDSSQSSGQRTIRVAPDTLMDFRALPFRDCAFKLVAFDPPHLTQAAPRSWMRAKYGVLGPDWSNDLRRGFAECFRVLEPEGVLVFKWSASHIPLREILALTDQKPLFGHTSGKRMDTHWAIFMKAATP